MADEDLQETERLIANFDGRRRVTWHASGRDFVDYHMSKGDGVPASGLSTVGDRAAPSRDRATVIITQRRRGRRGWLAWVAVGATMIAFGGSIAYLVGGANAATSPPSAGPIVSASPTPRMIVPPHEREIPPPPPPADPNSIEGSPVVIVASPPARPAPAKREPRRRGSGTAADEPMIPYRQRDDFIRDF